MSRDPWAVLRVGLCYTWRHHRLPDLAEPRRFTELVQDRKLEDCSPMQAALMDKLGAKRIAADRLGLEWIVPTAWCGERLPDLAPFAFPAFVKARHGCNQNAVLRQAPSEREWSALRRRTEGWTARPYGFWLDEWGYRDVPRGLLAEPLLGDGDALPVDYKIYVFGGRATHVQVHLGRGLRHRWILHDRDYRQLVPSADAPPPPASLGAMFDAAEALAAGQEFLRVDFYEVGGRPLFGEFCLYPGSGLDPFAADWIDRELGALWLAARAAKIASAEVGDDQPVAVVPRRMAE